MQISMLDPRVQMAARVMDYASTLSTRQQELINRFIGTILDHFSSADDPVIKVDNPHLIAQRLDEAFAERNARSDWNYQVWTYNF